MMSNPHSEKLIQALLSNFKKGQIAPFYLFTCQDLEALKNWQMQLMSSFYNFSGPQELNEIGHPDLLYINKDPKETSKSYLKDDPGLLELRRLLPYGCVKAKHRFFIIDQGHLLTEQILNKLLKVLEEPPKNTTIMINLPRGFKTLETIHSRAISIQIPVEQSAPQLKNFISKDTRLERFADLLEQRGLLNKDAQRFIENPIHIQEFVTALKRKREELQQVVTVMLDLASETSLSFKEAKQVEEDILNIQRVSTYNSNSYASLYRLFNAMFS
tara:strand:+ start:33210 stop:34025 length:816 start_codon:yes stop_codon:yes gene_type:complete